MLIAERIRGRLVDIEIGEVPGVGPRIRSTPSEN